MTKSLFVSRRCHPPAARWPSPSKSPRSLGGSEEVKVSVLGFWGLTQASLNRDETRKSQKRDAQGVGSGRAQSFGFGGFRCSDQVLRRRVSGTAFLVRLGFRVLYSIIGSLREGGSSG